MKIEEYLADLSFTIANFQEEMIIALANRYLNIDPVMVTYPQKPLLTEVHFYCDLQSKTLMAEQLEDLYQRLERGKKLVLKERMIEKQDWLVHWQRHFYPILIEDVIQVTPSWEKPNPLLPNLILEPKMGFGTGQHATTFLCLKAITQLHQQGDLKEKSIIDIGAGSGILGVAAVVLGASHALLLEIDEQSIESCHDTVNYNHVQEQCSVHHSDLFSEGEWHHRHYDIGFMNIIAEVIVEMLPLPMIKRIPTLILSGILAQKLPLVRKIIEQENFKVVSQEQKGDWLSLTVKT